MAHANVTINNILPERIDTERQRFMAELTAALHGRSVEESFRSRGGVPDSLATLRAINFVKVPSPARPARAVSSAA